MGIFLLTLIILLGGTGGILIMLALKPVKYAVSPAPWVSSCWMEVFMEREPIIGCYLCICAWETGVLLLTLLKARNEGYNEKCGQRSSLSTRLYRDGVMYYAFILSISVINIFWVLFGPSQPLFLMQRILHGIFTTRMLLNLRAAAVPPPCNTSILEEELWDDHIVTFDLVTTGSAGTVETASVETV